MRSGEAFSDVAVLLVWQVDPLRRLWWERVVRQLPGFSVRTLEFEVRNLRYAHQAVFRNRSFSSCVFGVANVLRRVQTASCNPWDSVRAWRDYGHLG